MHTYLHVIKLLTVIPLLLLVYSQTLLAAHAIPEFNATYAIQRFGIKLAEAHYRLSHTESGYKFSQDTRLHGFASLFADDTITATSNIKVSGDKLLLTSHQYVHRGSDNNETADITIQWSTHKNTLQGEISGVVEGKSIRYSTDTEIWDALSFQLPLMIEANKDIREYPYKALLDGEIEIYNFILTSTDEISFAGKQYRTLHVVRHDAVKKRELHIWVIPELHNIPVVVENYRNGELHSRMQLESVQFDNNKPLIEAMKDEDDDY